MLHNWLIKRGKTLSAFAAEVGVSHATISRLVNGRRGPSWDLAARIERATNGEVRAADLMSAASEARRKSAA